MGRRKEDNPLEAIFGICKAAGIICGLAYKGAQSIEKNRINKEKVHAKRQRLQACLQKVEKKEIITKTKNNIPKEINNYKKIEKKFCFMSIIRNFFAICCFADVFVALNDEQMPLAMLFPFLIIGLLLFTPTAKKINLVLESNPNKIAIKVLAVIIAFILAALFAPKT